jgi:uncharacterized protein with NRDE domain
MCTIVVWTRAFVDRPLVIAANRDEALDRPAEPPRLRPAGSLAPRNVLAPRDLRSGGTWWGVNDCGLVVAITNRFVRHPAGRRSRGAVVTQALGSDSAATALADLAAALDPADYAPFHLLLADVGGAGVLWNDGEQLHRVDLGAGFHVITERSFDAAATARPDLVRARASTHVHAPTHEQLFALLSDDGEGAGMEGVFVRPVNGYGTRSSTVIELGKVAALRHRGWEPAAEATTWTDLGSELYALLS